MWIDWYRKYQPAEPEYEFVGEWTNFQNILLNSLYAYFSPLCIENQIIYSIWSPGKWSMFYVLRWHLNEWICPWLSLWRFNITWSPFLFLMGHSVYIKLYLSKIWVFCVVFFVLFVFVLFIMPNVLMLPVYLDCSLLIGHLVLSNLYFLPVFQIHITLLVD